MYNPLDNAGLFLISTIFDLYSFVILLRMIMQWSQVNFYNPLAQFTFKLTEPVIKPLRKVCPKTRLIDIPLAVLLIVLAMVKILLIVFIQAGSFPHFGGLLIWAFADILSALINIFFYAILIMIIISWVNPTLSNPITDMLYRITQPLMGPARRFIPAIGGLDISPIPVLIGLQLIVILLVTPLARLGMSLALAG